MWMVVQKLSTMPMLGVMNGLGRLVIVGSTHLKDFTLEKKKMLFGLN
jgi:hypothetical protein